MAVAIQTASQPFINPLLLANNDHPNHDFVLLVVIVGNMTTRLPYYTANEYRGDTVYKK